MEILSFDRDKNFPFAGARELSVSILMPLLAILFWLGVSITKDIFSALCYAFSYWFWTWAVISSGHQAVHKRLFVSPLVNRFYYRFVFLPFGIDADLWAERHNRAHHPRPNTQGYDLDLDDSTFIRLSPYSELRWYHRFQGFYAPILYSFAGPIVVLIQDPMQFLRVYRSKANELKPSVIRFFLNKLIWSFYWFFIPVFVFDFNLRWMLFGFWLGSALSFWSFIPIGASHLYNGTRYFLSRQDADSRQRQLDTTIDFGTSSRIVTLLYGGLNYHRAHHLYPKLASRYYSEITLQIDEIQYKEALGFWELFREHFRLLNALSTKTIQK